MAKKTEQPHVEQAESDLNLPEFGHVTASDPGDFDVISLAEKLFVKHWNRAGQQVSPFQTVNELAKECLDSAEEFAHEAATHFRKYLKVADAS